MLVQCFISPKVYNAWLASALWFGSGMIEVYDFCSPWDESARSTKCMIAKHLQIVVDALSIAECIRVIRNEKDLHNFLCSGWRDNGWGYIPVLLPCSIGSLQLLVAPVVALEYMLWIVFNIFLLKTREDSSFTGVNRLQEQSSSVYSWLGTALRGRWGWRYCYCTF